MEDKAIEPITRQIMQFIGDFPELKKRYEDLPDEFALKARQLANHDKSMPQRLAALKTIKDTFELMYMDLENSAQIWQESHESESKDQQKLEERLTGSTIESSVMPSLEDCYRSSLVHTLFNMHRSTVQKYFVEKRIIGFQPNGKNRYFPKFQFDEYGPIKDLDKVLQSLGTNDENAIIFFLTANPELKFTKPIDSLKAGDVNQVVKAAAIYKRELLDPVNEGDST